MIRGLFEGDAWKALLEAAPDAMIVVDAGSTILLVNAQTERLFGYERSELVGQRLELLVPERSRPSHAGHVARFLEQPGRRPMGIGLELRGRHKDGTELPIEVSLSPLETRGGIAVTAAIRDVRERRRVEAERVLSAQRLESALESIEEAFAMFDGAGKLVGCNSTFRRLVGDAVHGSIVGKTHEHIASTWARTLTFADDGARDRWITHDLDGRPIAVEARTSDGRALRITERPTPEGGRVTVVLDLTEHAQRLDEMREARQTADAGNAAKTEFLSSMSHELRTPLNAILGFAQLLIRDKKLPLDPRQEARVQHILRGGNHLLRLIDDVLDLSRIDARKVSMSIEPIDLVLLVGEVVATLEPTATRLGVSLSRHPAPGDLPLVLGDRTRLAQVLMNLASNAVKYNRPGGHVVIELARTDDHRVRATVRDDGMGIPRDKQPLVFQPFQRAGQETGSIEGTGIGLAICKRLTEMMDGEIGFESTPGSGSRFWILVPAQTEASAHTPVSVARGRAVLPPTAGRRRVVLYVEDNPANVTFMEEYFSTLDDHELVVSPTAEEALVTARERRPDVILMDINLPGMSGLDALHALRAAPETASIPVIALTAAASPRDRERGEAAGFHRYLAKPVQLDELDAALASALEGR